ncbi:hypothetical protein K490DRAFT_71198 [Saccharata proteae CBS 121410]|uniref:Glucose-methanol-choline oxidoreductase N-terminal domain-containing protein n=1 Tax=Saccharata proteae CBS 121410 TaxID=1314787 RepID=A0A9P4M2H4_9PEZI|nr:hypothetical protein K490DRAFT_71198 [Saccharata proteae CBS 121410]
MAVLTEVMSLLLLSASSQSYYTDPTTNITFWQTTIPNTTTTGSFQFGVALPPNSTTTTTTEITPYEYIGHIVGALHNTNGTTTGWTGLSHSGGMPSSLLLLVWPSATKIHTSFRYATGYVAPSLYTGNSTLTQISSAVNATHFELVYRCQWCWVWNQDGVEGGQEPEDGEAVVVGWVQAFGSPQPVDSDEGTVSQHDNGMGEFGVKVESARDARYASWTSMTGTGNVATTTTATATTTTACKGSAVPTTPYDYIVVGAGAAGIPLADKLSESGKTVLLIERGPPSSGRWGGTESSASNWRPDWLSGTNLTRFDVPGLCNEIWTDSAGIACDDVDVMAGCVLGGGTAVNAALWWRAPAADWDDNFPEGWKAADMDDAVARVFDRIPGTDHPSADGQLFLQQGFDVLSSALADAGWKSVVANDVPNEKNEVYAHTPYMFSHGERGGPMATYLVTASQRSNFKLWMNTAVRRVVRTGGHVTGVEVESSTADGYCGIVNVTTATGGVILSAGTFGSSKILMRSGIGPMDQLEVVNSSSIDGPTMIADSKWIILPVGQNLNDHVNTNAVVTASPVVYHDFYADWDSPAASDKAAYLNNRTGILTQAAPNIGPIFWQTVHGSDGITRQLMWTARVENSLGSNTMTLSQYLGRGSTSRGALSITAGLTMTVSTVPYLHTDEDKAAVVQALKNLRTALAENPNITFIYPPANQTIEDYVDAYPVTTSDRTANHWVGTAKMGTDSGLEDGTAVVDTNARVYGTDNLYVVDASIFPGMMSTNPSALIVAAAEHASEKILEDTGASLRSRHPRPG